MYICIIMHIHTPTSHAMQVGDLQYASPATVSRCGMVYVDPKNLGYLPYWERWVNSLPSEADRREFSRLFDKYVKACISLILEGMVDGRQGDKLKTIIPVTNLNLVRHATVKENASVILSSLLLQLE